MRFIHLANVNLGAVPDPGCSWSSRRSEEIRETFHRVIAEIQASPVDLLFIAGDLFFRTPTRKDMGEADALFSSLDSTEVYLTIGTSKTKTAAMKQYAWSSNVHLITNEDLENSGEELLTAYQTALQQHSDPRDLKRSLEPLSVKETGMHGYLEGRVEQGRAVTKFIPCAVGSYHILAITLNEKSTFQQLESALKSEIQRRGENHIYRIHLKGRYSPSFLLIPEKLKLLGNILEIQDDSVPSYPIAELQKQYRGTLIGEYLDFFADLPEGTRRDEKAMYYGLQALLETSRHR